jgi:hypothetical protein
MLNVGVRLDRIVCNVEPESSAEPYMWTSFLHADMNTISLGHGQRMATYTPHANWTTRGVFPDGIGAGDSIDIPPSLGDYQVVLDPSGFNIALVGTLFVLMEQDSTPGDAIRAGHKAFAEAVDSIINTYVDQQFPNVPDPTEADIQALASQIQGEVMGAIRDELSAIHIFYNHDAFYGFGFLLLADLPEISVGGVRTTRNFSSRITGELAGLVNLPYDYQIELHVTCEPDEQPPDSCPRQYEVYSEAAAEVRHVDLEIQRITKELRSAPNDVRVPLKRELRELRTTRRPAALDLLDSAHQAYQLCHDGVFTLAANDPSKNQLKIARAARLARSAHGQIPVQATVAATTLL